MRNRKIAAIQRTVPGPEIRRAVPIGLALILLIMPIEAFGVRPERGYPQHPDSLNVKFEEVAFRTRDGVLLQGWFFPAKDTAKGTVIVSQTDAGNMGYLISYATFFAENGFHTLLYDYRGYGASQDFESLPSALIYPEYLLDLHAAVDFVRSRGEGPVVLYGISMGSVVSIGVAAERKDIAAVVVDGVYSKTGDAIRAIRKDQGKKSTLPSGFPPLAEPTKAVQSFSDTALLVLAGEDDKITNPRMAFEVFENCRSSKKSLWIADDAVHGRIHESVGSSRYGDHILGFLERVILRTSP